MELNIIKEEQNPLFDRKEIIATIITESTPRRQEVSKLLSEKYSVPYDSLRILNIKGKFGVKEFTINAHIYPSKQERDKYEKLTKKEIEAEQKQVPETNTTEVSETKKIEAEAKASEIPAEAPAKSQVSADVKTPVEESKKFEEKREEEDKKEKDKSKEEKLNETELQA